MLQDAKQINRVRSTTRQRTQAEAAFILRVQLTQYKHEKHPVEKLEQPLITDEAWWQQIAL